MGMTPASLSELRANEVAADRAVEAAAIASNRWWQHNQRDGM